MAMPESVKRDWEFFKPQTEEQLFERIDRALAQIEAGDYQDAEEVEAELMAKSCCSGSKVTRQ